MRFEVYRGRRGIFGRTQWRWRLRAANGKIIADSAESYNNRADCLMIIERIRQNAANALIKGIE
jgi:uncharacterized protein YegP (UPF0339 family)